MAHSNRLKLSDVREVFRIIGEVRVAGHDPSLWTRHMAEQLLRLVGAKTAFTGEGYATADSLIYNGFTAAGLTDTADIRGMDRFSSSAEVAQSRFMRAFADNHRTRFLATRDQLFDDADWYRSTYYHEFRAPCGLDGWLHSQFYLPDLGGSHMICLSRRPGDRRFTLREMRLLGLFHNELRRLWRDGIAVAASTGQPSLDVSALPPRLRQTLDCLCCGDSEKQAALRMGVSYHAVHANIKRLHRWFGVNSRGELLAKLNQEAPTRRYDFKPRLLGPPAHIAAPTAPAKPAERAVRERAPSRRATTHRARTGELALQC